MAQTLIVSFQGCETGFRLDKVDRETLYGSVEVEAFDPEGRRCEMMLLADDGRTLIGRGGTQLAHLSPEGDWCEKSQLKPLTFDGCAPEPVSSSFSAPVALTESATVEEYLEHIVKSVYLLTCEQQPSATLVEEVQAGSIFKFPFSYRGGLHCDVGFLIANTEGDLFLVVAECARLGFLSLAEASSAGEDELEDEELDFDLF